jgi:hypothetical protein
MPVTPSDSQRYGTCSSPPPTCASHLSLTVQHFRLEQPSVEIVQLAPRASRFPFSRPLTELGGSHRPPVETLALDNGPKNMAIRESGPGMEQTQVGAQFETLARLGGAQMASTDRGATWRSTLETQMTSSDQVNSLCCCPTRWRAGSAAKTVAAWACRGPPGKVGVFGSRHKPHPAIH